MALDLRVKKVAVSLTHSEYAALCELSKRERLTRPAVLRELLRKASDAPQNVTKRPTGRNGQAGRS